MRVLPIGVLLSLVCLPLMADSSPWNIDLQQRAVRRADPLQNNARRAAWTAKGRAGAPPADANVIEGSYDASVLAPIELIQQVYPVFNLEPNRQEHFRRDWKARGATALLGKDYWDRLRNVCGRAIYIDSETRRINALPPQERARLAAAKQSEAPRPWSDSGECVAEADALKAGRAMWGDAFDRFLYEVVAPGVYFWSSCSEPRLMETPEFWLTEWNAQEGGCQ